MGCSSSLEDYPGAVMIVGYSAFIKQGGSGSMKAEGCNEMIIYPDRVSYDICGCGCCNGCCQTELPFDDMYSLNTTMFNQLVIQTK